MPNLTAILWVPLMALGLRWGLNDTMKAFCSHPGMGHWFFQPDRTQAFNEATTGLAQERTVTFLRG